MSGGAWAVTGQKRLAREPGVADAPVNYATGKATLTSDDAQVTIAELVQAIRDTLDLLLRSFPIRTCSPSKFNQHQRLGRPCLLFHIEKRTGPCVGEIDQARDYLNALDKLSSLRLCSNAPAQWAVQTALGGYQSIRDLVTPGGRLYESRRAIQTAVTGSRFLRLTPSPLGAMYAFIGVDEAELPGLQPEVRDWEPRLALVGETHTGELARAAGCSPGTMNVIVSVASTPPSLFLTEGFVPEELLEEEKKRTQAVLDEGIASLTEKGFKASGHLAVGEPVEEICRLAKELGVDLIVVGHNQKTSFAARWWKGSVGASLIDYAPCSILIALSHS